MSISSIKPEMLLPERELIINKRFTLRQKPALIASITEQNGVVKLWVFQQIPDSPVTNISDDEFIQCTSNLDEILSRVSRTRVSFSSISDITIKNVNLPISQSSSGSIGYGYMEHMKLQHFIEAGVDFLTLEDISLDELILSEYRMEEGASFPEIDAKSDMPVSLCIRGESCEVLIEPSHFFKLRTGEQDIECSFYDSSRGEEVVYYIDRVYLYDIRKEMESRFEDVKTLEAWREQGFDDAQIDQMKANLPGLIEPICPKGNELLILQYECSDDIQLNFYTSEFLHSRPKNTGTSTVAMFNSADEKSRHGYKVRLCLLKDVPCGFDGEVEVELISRYKNIPGEKIEF